MAEDSGASPLPRRVPGNKRGPGIEQSGPLVRPMLSEQDLERIRAALDSAGDEPSPQEHAATAELPASLPRRVRGAGDRPEPPTHMAWPASSASLLNSGSEEVQEELSPAVPVSRPGEVAEDAEAELDTSASPESVTAAPADAALVPVQRPPAEQQPDRQDRDEEAASPQKAPAHQQNGQARPRKAQPRPPKPAPPPRPEQSRPPRLTRRRGLTRALVVLLVVVSAGSVAYAVTRHTQTAVVTARASPEVAARERAAAWVASQVSRAAPISCDQVMCLALEARGVPAADLRVLRPGAADPPRSGVIVVTATVTTMVGSRLIAAKAPAVIASFGSGNMRVSIRTIFPEGAAAYAAALSKDLAARQQGETTLLQNPRIMASATARQELQSGQVDSRLLLTLAELASQWPVSIVAFSDRAPGAGPGIPFRCADLAETIGSASPDPANQVQLMSAFVHRLGGFYSGASIRMVRLAADQTALQIGFLAPSPLGLLSAGAP